MAAWGAPTAHAPVKLVKQHILKKCFQVSEAGSKGIENEENVIQKKKKNVIQYFNVFR